MAWVRYYFYFEIGFASTRYQLVPRGDTNEVAQDLRVMARVGDSAIYMIDEVTTHMLIEGEIIEQSCNTSWLTLRDTAWHEDVKTVF